MSEEDIREFILSLTPQAVFITLFNAIKAHKKEVLRLLVEQKKLQDELEKLMGNEGV